MDGRLTAIQTPGIQSLSYGYNINDEIAQIVNGADANLTQTFGYDALSRLTSAAAPGNTAGFGYDAIGNRASRTDNGVATNYAYPATSHRLQSAVSPGLSRTFTTNAVGNIAQWTGADGIANAMTYDAYLRPKQHARNGVSTNYTINALDQRVIKNSGGGTQTRYVYAGQNTLLAERFTNGATNTSTWTSYLWLGGQPVGMVRNNALYWIHSDHLGRPEMATNANQQRVWRAANWAFNRSVMLDQIGGLNLGFPGQYYDAESNLWHNGFRDYEPTLGRYLQSDPIGLAGGISTYGYVGGNPVSLIDPLGLKTLCEALAQVAATASTNPLLNGSRFDKSMLGREEMAGSEASKFPGHFTDHRNNQEYDIQYTQVAWSITKTYGPGSPNLAMNGYMLAPLVSGDRSYFSKRNISANIRGLQLGEFGAKNFESFQDFVNDLCPKLKCPNGK